MPIWLLPAEFFAKLALKFGFAWIEKKYPGSKLILDKILSVIQSVNSVPTGNQQLSDHLDNFVCTPGTPGCPPGLVG